MLVLVNTNRMQPAIAPIGLDYVAGAARAAGIEIELCDLCLAADPPHALGRALAGQEPDLVGITFRNVDDCFWPSGQSFLPELVEAVRAVRRHTDAPIVLGGVGFSIFGLRIVRHVCAQLDAAGEGPGRMFGIRGDGEQAVVALHDALTGGRDLRHVPGLIWRRDGEYVANPPAWPDELRLPTRRDTVENAVYFHLGGQGGIETKRGCPRRCIYCADPVAKGPHARTRPPQDVADEVESLLAAGVDVLHICDGEFNVPYEHALAVCRELIRRRLGGKVRWYTYMAVTPFEEDLAEAMRRAGCVGIDFTGDAACEAMLAAYAQPHRREDLARAVRLCREHDLAVMVDLLLGGPGETPETVRETVGFLKQIGPDCVGAGLGMRLYPGTPAAGVGGGGNTTGLRRHYAGEVDLLWPTFYISPALGEAPASLVREIIGGDERFFAPAEQAPSGHADRDHNYNANAPLTDAISAGARGAYWHILRGLS